MSEWSEMCCCRASIVSVSQLSHDGDKDISGGREPRFTLGGKTRQSSVTTFNAYADDPLELKGHSGRNGYDGNFIGK